MIFEEHANEVVLEPAPVLEVETYRDGQIAEWDRKDSIRDADRERIARAATALHHAF